VLMHPGVVAEGVDLGNLRRSYAKGRGQRPRLQHQRCEGNPRFGFGAGNLADRDATSNRPLTEA
jgi:hypothetical protein